VRFLGARVSFDGGISLPGDKAEEMFRELEKRLRRAARAFRVARPIAERDEELRLLCAVAADGLRLDSPFALPHAGDLRSEIDDRGHLRDLDLRLSRLVVAVATGARSPRALRDVPIARLRSLGLPCLVNWRNGAR
jgi:hypothetical protein